MPEKTPAYRNAALPVEKRVKDLLARMTLEEKLRQMLQLDSGKVLNNGRLVKKSVPELLGGEGIGTLQDPRHDPRTNAEALNAIQQYLFRKTRLGIPALVISECLHGHMSPGATVFPQAIGLGSTWNETLVRRMAAVAAREASAVGVRQALAPDLDLARDARWGRVEETYGEDAHLAARLGSAYVRGLQGRDRNPGRDKLAATVKHFAAHGSPEGGVNLAPVAVGPRELRSLYLVPFRTALVECGALSVMPAYSEFDGVPCSGSQFLLTTLLRDEWGFEGYVYSDYGAIQMLETFHRTAGSAEEAGEQALRAGMDLEAPTPYGFGDTLRKAVKAGRVPVELVDRAVARILRVKFRLGLFESAMVDADRAVDVVGCRRHRQVALQVARESIVLLENRRKTLPLDRKTKRIAVIGPNADRAQFGDYSYEKDSAVTPLKGIERTVSRRSSVCYARGCGTWEKSLDGIAEAVELARQSDVAVLCLGGSSMARAGVGWGHGSNWSATCGEGFDRADLTLPGVQPELAEAVIGTGTPTVLVLITGRPCILGPWSSSAAAVVLAWYPGEEGGTALAEILFGLHNPSGRLPISFPRSVGHVPVSYDHKPSARGYYKRPGSPEKPGRDYVFSETTPLYPFGYGLSYTTFKVSNLTLSKRVIRAGDPVTVTVDAENTGQRAGKEVVQLYLSDEISSVTTPVRALKAFRKVNLAPGRKKTVRFRLTADDMSILDADMKKVVEPGTFRVRVGRLSRRFRVR